MTLLATLTTSPTPVLDENQKKDAWRRVSNSLSTLVTVLVVLMALSAITLSVATHLSSPGQYTVFGHPVMTVMSGSMSPAIRTGDLVVDDAVTSAQAQHLHVGQVISVRDTPASQFVITHRIVGVQHIGGSVFYVTKGDANSAPDATVRPAADLVGVVSATVPAGGYVLNALHRPLVVGLLVASVVLAFVAGPLLRWARTVDEAGVADVGATDDEVDEERR